MKVNGINVHVSKSKFPIIVSLDKKDPNRNFVFTAIEVFKTPRKLNRFLQEYIKFIEQYSESASARAAAASIAKSNIGYILGYYGESAHKLWFNTLKDVSHPIFGPEFGRTSNPTSKQAFNIGKHLGKKRGLKTF